MSKRVANTRSKTARNGRVRLGFHTKRRRDHKEVVHEHYANVVEQHKPQTPKRPSAFAKFRSMFSRKFRSMFSRRGS